MKKQGITIFRRISALILCLVTALSLIFIAITYISTTQFYQASTQLLNKDVAAHIAKFASPYEPGQFNRERADSVFYNAMVISPSIEVYFLDTAGKVIYYHAADSAIRSRLLPLENIRKHIERQGNDYIKGPDPRHPGDPKIFSAAEVLYRGKKIGYIYVILGSNEYQNVTDMFLESHIGMLIIEIVVVIALFSAAISILYVNRLQRRFGKVISVLGQYSKGNFGVRFGMDERDEFAPVTHAFDKMADMLLVNYEKLKTSEKERKDFVANISHDLRTPLAIARGFTETMLGRMNENGMSVKEQEGYTQQVLRKILQIENMVQQLFELSKMESVEFRTKKEPLVFSEILQEMISTSKTAAENKQVMINCTGCHEPAWIFADIRMMERVIQNLMDNAIKYTPENGRIEILLTKNANMLTVSFENTGKAISEELRQWVNQAHGEKQIRPSTSGLGLTIVKKILVLHGYPFFAETAVAGTRFSINMGIYNAHTPTS